MKEKENEDAEQGYLKMPAWKYYTLTIFIYVVCVIPSIFFDDLSVVFDLVGAFGLSITSFMLPGVMYLLILRNPKANTQIETVRQSFFNKVGSIFVILISLANMVLAVYKQCV